MKPVSVWLVTLYCTVGLENYLAQMIFMTRQCVGGKNKGEGHSPFLTFLHRLQ